MNSPNETSNLLLTLLGQTKTVYCSTDSNASFIICEASRSGWHSEVAQLEAWLISGCLKRLSSMASTSTCWRVRAPGRWLAQFTRLASIPTILLIVFKTDLQPSWFFRQLPGGGYWYLLYKYRWRQFDSMLRKYLGQARMEQLILPMFTVSVDLVQGEPVVREADDATIGVMESINLPPLSLPIIESGQALVDGGLLNNVPANVLVAKGCNFVIASTVTAKLEKDFEGIRSKVRQPVPGNNSSDHATDHGPGLQHELRRSTAGRLCARARRDVF